MKAINNFLDKASLWKVFVLTTILFGGIGFIMFDGLTPDAIKLSLTILIKISAAIGIMCGGLFTLSINMGRESSKFWAAAKEFEDLLHAATTKEHTYPLFNEGLLKLNQYANGSYHMNEVNRLYSMLKIKHNLLK